MGLARPAVEFTLDYATRTLHRVSLTNATPSTSTSTRRYDLYSKGDTPPDAEALWPYYQGLIDKYLGPGKFDW